MVTVQLVPVNQVTVGIPVRMVLLGKMELVDTQVIAVSLDTAAFVDYLATRDSVG